MTEGRYVAPARWLHWLTAGAIVVILITGFWMTFFEPADKAFKLRLYNIHESFGVTVFALTLARLWVRWRNPPPPLPADLPAVMKLGAAVNHAALYVLLIVQPVVGFLNTNAWGFPLAWFGLVPILSQLHWLGALAMLALLGMHVAAVVFHTFIRKDGMFARMA